jgi:hypothetical protein
MNGNDGGEFADQLTKVRCFVSLATNPTPKGTSKPNRLQQNWTSTMLATELDLHNARVLGVPHSHRFLHKLCHNTVKASPHFPLLWTENEGWYHPWGSAPIDGGAGMESVHANFHGGVGCAKGGGGETCPPVALTNNLGISEDPNRDPADLAAAVARWVARGGAMMNYYMYFGGYGRILTRSCSRSCDWITYLLWLMPACV